MIDGEIYALDHAPRCVFAYCERGSCRTSFYIGVCSSSPDHVEISEQGIIKGMSYNAPSHLATGQELERFHRVLEENGYKWNKANKAIIKNGTEIIKI
jgi:hypothetical protein